ncbi:hypothetical protein JG687_00013885 [Phytophthora cactorum]|uniref:Uncharacterized protein n=2 Tax=Phytophthora cactorum TaxID=29920 RepID=A0A8T1U0R2_9STRA|nr:hypothetical protein PC120_g9380 [Phytophthora cactorum]KAG3051016.1 hypothetical protein PC121_g18066 [Phytophthora cactorum]KAG3164113.1 hypothetical protein PC128_g20224 [Phytophthora cactorum]KAG4046675.1 hypothetical protein PC123_g17946 [Phytophthora cactorum]KAG6951021.1 hypothetical protein JG687_00013885 [Phytophthora cactorum]
MDMDPLNSAREMSSNDWDVALNTDALPVTTEMYPTGVVVYLGCGNGHGFVGRKIEHILEYWSARGRECDIG